MNKCAAIIVAGGSGRRFGSKTPKQFLNLLGRPVYLWSVLAFRKTGRFSQIILVAPKGWDKRLSAAAKKYSFDVVRGGRERSDSVMAGLKKLNSGVDIVAVHDAARPLVTPGVIELAVKAAKTSGAAVVSVPARDTVKFVSGSKVISTVPRERIWLAQTPQVFKRKIIDSAYSMLGAWKVTDDAQAVERAGCAVVTVMGDYSNIKITDKEDFNNAQMRLKKLPK